MAFYPDSRSCDLMSSQSPMPQSWVDAEAAWRDSMEGVFVNGNATLNDLIQALGGNPPQVLPGDAGIPTSGPVGPGNWYNGIQLSEWQASAAFTPTNEAECVVPEVLPLVTVISLPAAAQIPAASGPPGSSSNAWLWAAGGLLGLLALAGGGRKR